MILVMETQYRENYGAHNWDGVGACPQYWKNKGGSSYLIPMGSSINAAALGQVLAVAAERLERHTDFEEEFIIGWHIESDDYVPEDERLQLEYDGGHITYPSPRLDPVTFERTNPRYVPSPAMEAFLMQQG